MNPLAEAKNASTLIDINVEAIEVLLRDLAKKHGTKHGSDIDLCISEIKIALRSCLMAMKVNTSPEKERQSLSRPRRSNGRMEKKNLVSENKPWRNAWKVKGRERWEDHGGKNQNQTRFSIRNPLGFKSKPSAAPTRNGSWNGTSSGSRKKHRHGFVEFENDPDTNMEYTDADWNNRKTLDTSMTKLMGLMMSEEFTPHLKRQQQQQNQQSRYDYDNGTGSRSRSRSRAGSGMSADMLSDYAMSPDRLVSQSEPNTTISEKNVHMTQDVNGNEYRKSYGNVNINGNNGVAVTAAPFAAATSHTYNNDDGDYASVYEYDVESMNMGTGIGINDYETPMAPLDPADILHPSLPSHTNTQLTTTAPTPLPMPTPTTAKTHLSSSSESSSTLKNRRSSVAPQRLPPPPPERKPPRASSSIRALLINAKPISPPQLQQPQNSYSSSFKLPATGILTQYDKNRSGSTNASSPSRALDEVTSHDESPTMDNLFDISGNPVTAESMFLQLKSDLSVTTTPAP